jgi:hypothetical protein
MPKVRPATHNVPAKASRTRWLPEVMWPMARMEASIISMARQELSRLIMPPSAIRLPDIQNRVITKSLTFHKHLPISPRRSTGNDANGPVLYLFTETSGNPGATSSLWQSSPIYVDSRTHSWQNLHLYRDYARCICQSQQPIQPSQCKHGSYRTQTIASA